MAQPLTGRNPLSYLGVEAITPPNMIVSPTSPTPSDSRNVTIGDMWINRNTQNFYVLTSLAGGVATWTQVEGSAANQFETDDSHIAIPIGGLLVIHGGNGIITSSSGNVVTITATGGAENVTYVNTSPYVVQPTDALLDVDSSGGPITIELPNTPTEGKSVIIKDLMGTSSSNNITVTTVSGSTTIDGSTSYVIASNHLSIETTGNSQGSYDISLGYTPLSATSITFDGDLGSTTPQAGVISFIGSGGGQTLSFRITFAGELDLLTSNITTHNTILGGGGNVGSGLNNATNNTGLGYLSLSNIHNSSSNTGIGFSSLANIDFGTTGTSGAFNCGLGDSSLVNLVGGAYNCAYGYQAGINLTANESSNVYINNPGTTSESTTLRIGSATGTGNQNLHQAFICGIQGVNVGSVASVVSISGDQLGSTTITAGSGITVTPGANTITIASSSSGITTLDGDIGTGVSGSTINIKTGYTDDTSTVPLPQGTPHFSGDGVSTLTLIMNDPGENIGLGTHSLASIAVGSGGASNIAIGFQSGQSLVGGNGNVFIGTDAGVDNVSGISNTGIGVSALDTLTGGTANIAIGNLAGSHLSSAESNNIYFNSLGVAAESNTLRIGDATGSGIRDLANAYISGIQGVSVGSVASVVSISGDHLGTTTITAGSGISVTPAANSITIAATGSGVTTVNGDTGSATGSTLTLTGVGSGRVRFTATGSTISLQSSDSNGNLGWGGSALNSLTSGLQNCCVGPGAGLSITSGNQNTILGQNSGTGFNTGSANLLLGFNSGSNLGSTESSNVYLNNAGVLHESNALRIGSGTGTSSQQLNSAFISGITGITVTGSAVLVSSSDQLGVAVSSRRFKSDIQDMGSDSSVIQELRPVSFTWNQDSAPGLKDATTMRQYGLIAEEAIEHVPHAVNIGPDGNPLNINYQDLIGMMINEIQRLNKRIEALEAK